jgi:hypothetical protein
MLYKQQYFPNTNTTLSARGGGGQIWEVYNLQRSPHESKEQTNVFLEIKVPGKSGVQFQGERNGN